MIIDVQNVLLDKIYDNPDFNPGDIYIDNQSRSFRFVQYNQGDGSVDAVAGQLAIGLDSAYGPWEVTMDYSTSTIAGIANRQLGFFQAALTDGKYGWIQRTGLNKVAALTDNGITQGQMVMKHATTDGSIDSHTGDVPILGVALEADSGTALAIGHLDIMIGI